MSESGSAAVDYALKMSVPTKIEIEDFCLEVNWREAGRNGVFCLTGRNPILFITLPHNMGPAKQMFGNGPNTVYLEAKPNAKYQYRRLHEVINLHITNVYAPKGFLEGITLRVSITEQHPDKIPSL